MESDPKSYRATFAEPILDSALRVELSAADGTRVTGTLPIIVGSDTLGDATEPVWLPIPPPPKKPDPQPGNA